MPAARFEDWTHLRVVGEREDAQPFMPFARKLLGFVFDQAAFNQLHTHAARREFEDGTIVIAEKFGDIPRVTIIPGPRALESIPLRPPSDFVVWARDAGRPAGIDATHPQQILQVRADKQTGTAHFWKTYFFDEDIAGFEAFAGAKATYSGVLPEGLRHAGNLDWCGRDGERLSWHGPTARYWVDGWRQPSRQYGRHVYMLGQVLLDVDAYCTEAGVNFNERLVLGAARRGLHLYVMHGRIDDIADPTFVPVGRGGDVYVTPPYPTGAVPLCLRRYGLLVDPDPNQAMRLRVDVGSDQVVWQDAVAAAVNPWFFSPGAEAAETFAMPVAPGFRRYQDAADVYHYDLPSASSTNVRLAIEDDAAVATTHAVSLPFNQMEGEAPIAVDFEESGARVELRLRYEAFRDPPAPNPDGDLVPFTAPWAHRYLVAGDTVVPLYTGNPVDSNQRWSVVYGVDLRHRAFVLVQKRQLDAEWNFEARLVVHHAGRVEAARLLASKNVPNGGPPPHAMWDRLGADAGATTFSPLAYLFGPVAFGDYDHDPGALVPPQGFYLDRGFGPTTWSLCRRSEAFGVAAIYAPTNGGAVGLLDPISGRGANRYWNDRIDTDGFYAPAATAADGTTLLYSGPGASADYDAGAVLGVHYVTDAELTDLTGVDGADARFHTLWRLGKQPRLA